MKHSQTISLEQLGPACRAQVLALTQPERAIQALAIRPEVSFAITPSTDEQKLNRTELAFLYWLRATRTHEDIGVQSLTFKLGDDCRYTPDFSAVRERRLYIYEVKGHWEDDARVKIKAAARMFRWACFVAVQKRKGGGWDFELINP